MEQDGKIYLTENQWRKKHRAVLKRQLDKGIYEEWYINRREMASATYYTEEQTRPYTKRELAAEKAAKIRKLKAEIEAL